MLTPKFAGETVAAENRPRAYKFGWYGDSGLGDALIDKILSGEKTASLCPAYDPEEAAVGELLRVVDKTGKTRAVIKIVRMEYLKFSSVTDDLARNIGSTLEDIRRISSFANSRPIGDDEEMRATYFELISVH